MRVSTAFNRMLQIPGAWVESVAFGPEGIVVGIRVRGRRLCCPCGYWTRARYDTSRRRWRTIFFGTSVSHGLTGARVQQREDSGDSISPLGFFHWQEMCCSPSCSSTLAFHIWPPTDPQSSCAP